MRAVDEYLAMATALDPRLDALVSLLVFDGVKLGEALAPRRRRCHRKATEGVVDYSPQGRCSERSVALARSTTVAFAAALMPDCAPALAADGGGNRA